MEMKTVTKKQADILQGFFTHCASVYFDGMKSDFGFYAEKLDNAGINWSVQNLVAMAAESRQNVFGLYFKNVLKNIGIQIKEKTA